MDQQLLELFDRFAGLAYDRQQRFAEFTAKKAPGAKKHLDEAEGVLSFGPKLQFEALLAGVHAEHNDSWMWTWANRTIKLSLTNRALGDTIRALAHKAMTPTFAKSAFPLEMVLGAELVPHAVAVFGTILLGELDYDAYVAAKHEGNPALYLVKDERLRATEKHPLARMLALFPKALKALPVSDHRAAFESYVHGYGYTPAGEGDTAKVVAGKSELIATFDERGKLKKLARVNVAPAKKPTAKSKPAAKEKPKAMAKPAAKANPKAKTKTKLKRN
ncbi:MAG: hypothetical protein U0791_13485 [Gemmataceae bacterium]